MEDGLPYPDGQNTPPPARRILRTAKNKEKALKKKEHREEKRRKSEPNVQGSPYSSEQEVENIMPRPATELREATPIVKSLIETFRPKVLSGFMVRLSSLDGYACFELVLNSCSDELHPSGTSLGQAEAILLWHCEQCSRHETGDTKRSPYAFVSISILAPP